GVALMTWPLESFAYADGHDAAADRYAALRGGANVAVTEESSGLVVKPDRARRQMETEERVAGGTGPGTMPPTGGSAGGQSRDGKNPGTGMTPKPAVRRFFGTVKLDSTRVGGDASRIAEEVIAHLVGQAGAEVTVR